MFLAGKAPKLLTHRFVVCITDQEDGIATGRPYNTASDGGYLGFRERSRHSFSIVSNILGSFQYMGKGAKVQRS